MANIKVTSVKGSPVKVYVDGVDFTDHIAADPRPVITIAPAGEVGTSTLTLTLVGSIEADVDGTVDDGGEV